MKIWVDDIREAPEGYYRARTTFQVIDALICYRSLITLIDLDHDAGDYVELGGDYIEILNYMEEHNINDIPIRIHSKNPVGVENMRRIIKRNGWEEVR